MPIIHPSVFAPSDQDLSSSSISSSLYTSLYTSATDLDLDLGVEFCVGDDVSPDSSPSPSEVCEFDIVEKKVMRTLDNLEM